MFLFHWKEQYSPLQKQALSTKISGIIKVDKD